MARPKKSAADRRTAPVLVKLTTAEHAQLSKEAARLHAPSVTALVRERALSGTVTVQATRQLAAADRLALHRVGVNLNQIARRLNEHGVRAADDIAGQVEASLAQLNSLLLVGADDGA